MNNPLKPYEARIIGKKQETYDTVTYTFQFQEDEPKNKYRYTPGQFNMVGFFGTGEAAISMSSHPNGNAEFDHTFRIVGNVTQALANKNEGDTAWIRGPYGRGWPMQEAMHKDVIIIAGGVGLSPLRSAIEHILANRSNFGDLSILYGAKTPRDMVHRDDFDRWESSPDTKLFLTVDRVDGEKWRGNVGVVPTLLNAVSFFPEDTIALVCGPEIMMKFTVLDLEKRGFPPAQIHLSMERRMKCAVAQCGHCFLGSKFVCKDGPVFPHTELMGLLIEGV